LVILLAKFRKEGERTIFVDTVQGFIGLKSGAITPVQVKV